LGVEFWITTHHFAEARHIHISGIAYDAHIDALCSIVYNFHASFLTHIGSHASAVVLHNAAVENVENVLDGDSRHSVATLCHIFCGCS
jgi:hypothetical protein